MQCLLDVLLDLLFLLEFKCLLLVHLADNPLIFLAFFLISIVGISFLACLQKIMLYIQMQTSCYIDYLAKALNSGVLDVISISVSYVIPLLSYIDQHDSTFQPLQVLFMPFRDHCVSSPGNYGPFSQTISNTAPSPAIDKGFPPAITHGNIALRVK